MLLDMDTFPWYHQLEQDILKVKYAVMSAFGQVERGIRSLEATRQVGHVLKEVTEILSLPTFDAEAAARQEAFSPVTLDMKVMEQLEAYIHAIAALYRNNAFHNFEHVSHVTMSVTKLFSRIVAPEVSGEDRTLHDHTYGITSDPLTQFAAAFAALIHDLDHQGVTNSTLIEENSPIAAVYNNKSVAEPNSVNMAWSLLLDDSFTDLRNCIYTTPTEYNQFRQLIVNMVMATDIMDKSLSQACKDRWVKAFSGGGDSSNEIREDLEQQINRKATIVLEHVIQASDVSHTMQHWHIYCKWNARLFEEMMVAYRQGRTQKNPADLWYEGEISFFDFYIIPLAKKLKECGVFGVSSDEYLNYAKTNRKEWEAKGREVVAEMVARFGTLPVPTAYHLSS
ncbi:calcium/calmodulin-dependent 3',5'-cyclic nucleotide phosphodiesterase [Fistulifera solaris]|uniref:Calcium/calmodulin-dependent 3',5'-cyclic nucleotide phosphodiesterase n=1 Tax=Fistulifera solaris TaxID=1519565 RepID=A0A1Z5JW30_FISSO|nr:calcium/calmodulin-dependent 3',5'-cyclic nucleotide phosphodiesterase [Fistulifera solaris]|eukprot:GAX18247.1 calcium/calmodulin-dependent 3',5'-cyclic nucleotide phosphodiesterase [Fistulifera solaris]